jgi:hypothetical protein
MKTLRLLFAIALLSVASAACASPVGVECDGAVCHEPDGSNQSPNGAGHEPDGSN